MKAPNYQYINNDNQSIEKKIEGLHLQLVELCKKVQAGKANAPSFAIILALQQCESTRSVALGTHGEIMQLLANMAINDPEFKKMLIDTANFFVNLESDYGKTVLGSNKFFEELDASFSKKQKKID